MIKNCDKCVSASPDDCATCEGRLPDTLREHAAWAKARPHTMPRNMVDDLLVSAQLLEAQEFTPDDKHLYVVKFDKTVDAIDAETIFEGLRKALPKGTHLFGFYAGVDLEEYDYEAVRAMRDELNSFLEAHDEV